jgi:hypothetical protein
MTHPMSALFHPPPAPANTSARASALRQRRSRAAQALATHERRGQFGWDDLAAWPDWADSADWADSTHSADGTTAVHALATRVGAVWQAHAVRHCIHGVTLKRLQQVLGEDTVQALCRADMHANQDDIIALPPADQIEAWLQAQGAEVMLAALPSPLLRLVLRERLWPHALPRLSPPDMAAAARTVQRAQALPAAKKAAP